MKEKFAIADQAIGKERITERNSIHSFQRKSWDHACHSTKEQSGDNHMNIEQVWKNIWLDSKKKKD